MKNFKLSSILLMTIWPLLISVSIGSVSPGFAQESVYLNYQCDNSNSVHRYLKSIAIPSDKIQIERDGINIVTKSSRRYLFERLFRLKFSNCQSATESIPPTPPCRLKLETEGQVDENSTLAKISKSKKGTLQASQNKAEILSSSTLLIQSGHYGTLRTATSKAYLKCHRRGKIYQIEVSLDQRFEGSFSTTLALSPGQRIEVGSVVDRLKEDQANADTSSGLEIQNESKIEAKKYYLSVK